MAAPFCYVTSKGVVRSELLESFAMKSKAIPVDAFTAVYGQAGLIEPIYPPSTLISLLELNVYHSRCVAVKSKDTAGLGWSLVSTEDSPSAQAEAVKALIEETLDNMEMPLTMILDRVLTDYDSVGYAVIEVVREAEQVEGELVQLVHVPSSSVRIHRSKNKFAQIIGGQTRWFKALNYPMDVHQDTGVEYALGTIDASKCATEMLFLASYSPRSSYYGLPCITPAIGCIVGDTSRRDYNVSFFENYGVPAYAVFITGNFDGGEPVDADGNPDPTGRTPLEREIESHIDELAKNPHSVLVLSLPSVAGVEGDVKIEFKPLSTDVKEASFRLYRLDNRDEVIAAHGIPLNRLGIDKTGALAGSTALEATKVYKMSVIKPLQEMLETIITRNILHGMFETTAWKFELNEIDLEDTAAEIAAVKELFAMGGCTPNEIIRKFGEKYGFVESDNPAMDLHYLNNTAIDGEAPEEAQQDAVDTVQQLDQQSQIPMPVMPVDNPVPVG